MPCAKPGVQRGSKLSVGSITGGWRRKRPAPVGLPGKRASLSLGEVLASVVSDLVIIQDGLAQVTEIGMDPRRLHALGHWAASNAKRRDLKAWHKVVVAHSVPVPELHRMLFHVVFQAVERALSAKPLQIIIAHAINSFQGAYLVTQFIIR